MLVLVVVGGFWDEKGAIRSRMKTMGFGFNKDGFGLCGIISFVEFSHVLLARKETGGKKKSLHFVSTVPQLVLFFFAL